MLMHKSLLAEGKGKGKCGFV